MKYWLMKSEPGCFSIDDLAKAKQKTTSWDGVRNYQARNFMRDEMKLGDQAFFYHSSCAEPGIVGTMEVVREAHPDHTAFDPEGDHYDPKSTLDNPRWFMVDVKLKQKFPSSISLSAIKQNPRLKDLMILRKGNRLSITPVTKQQWQAVMGML